MSELLKAASPLKDILSRIKLALALVLVILGLLTGCATVQTGPLPPSELLEDCLPGKLSFRTNAEVTDSVAELANTIRLCNIDKRKLREWRQDALK